MTAIVADLVLRAWRRVDIKLSIDSELHVLRWRRRLFADEVLFDERQIATATGLFDRDGLFGLNVRSSSGEETRLLFSVDAKPDWMDWSGDMRPRGVRLETADAPLIAVGSLGPDRMEPFRRAFDRAVKAMGLD